MLNSKEVMTLERRSLAIIMYQTKEVSRLETTYGTESNLWNCLIEGETRPEVKA